MLVWKRWGGHNSWNPVYEFLEVPELEVEIVAELKENIGLQDCIWDEDFSEMQKNVPDL